jgi:ABC-type uncharacterized transport system ATPase subunit
MNYAIEMNGITKIFPGIKANDTVTLQVVDKEIHALLGENGAGKSTLMSVLFGLYQPEEGFIKVRGKEVEITNPNIANELGIGMVHQHFKLVENFTVTENIILGAEPLDKFRRIDIDTAAKKVAEISKQYGLKVDPHSKIEDITVGMQQRVEILKMLYRDANILIFDEPTAVLTPQEIVELMKIMKGLVKEYIGTVDVAATSEKELAEMMVGRPVSFEVKKGPAKPGETICEIKGLNVLDNRKLPAVKDFTLNIRPGEIMCVAGIDGNGQSELIEALYGLRKVESGEIILNGEDITNYSIRKRVESGIGHIPEDRHKYGLILDFRLDSNFVLLDYYKEAYQKHGLIKFDAILENSERLIKDFDVRSGKDSASMARTMSGGNQQKAIIAREIDRSPQLLIAAQPTRGLDVGAIEYIHKRLVEERDKGKAVLVISLELEEVLNVSDKIAVMYEGEIVGVVETKKTSANELGLMMSGSTRGDVNVN